MTAPERTNPPTESAAGSRHFDKGTSGCDSDHTTARAAIAELQAQVDAAESRALRAEHERDELRALLSRLRTSLAEATTLQDGAP